MKKDADGKVVAGSHENCCGDADSCPMIKKDAAGKQVAGSGHSCCCCGDGESCPMKDKAAAATVTAVSMRRPSRWFQQKPPKLARPSNAR